MSTPEVFHLLLCRRGSLVEEHAGTFDTLTDAQEAGKEVMRTYQASYVRSRVRKVNAEPGHHKGYGKPN